MTDLPTLALSVRQPWAWAIIHAGKNIENRSQFSIRHMNLRKGERIAIHAAKGMTRDEYELAEDFISSRGIEIPPACDLMRGGIIGSVEVVDVISDSMSWWFMGPKGIILRDPVACDFIPAVGALGLFEWKPADASIVPPLARWMQPDQPAQIMRRARPCKQSALPTPDDAGLLDLMREPVTKVSAPGGAPDA